VRRSEPTTWRWRNRQEGAAHRQRVAEIRSGGIALVMAEAAARQRPVGQHPLRCAERIAQRSGVAAVFGPGGQCLDQLTVRQGIQVRIDARHTLLAALRIVEREIAVGMFSRLQVGILADAEGTAGVLQERVEIAADFIDCRAVAVAAERRPGQGVYAQILCLHGRELLEMRVLPVAEGRVLVDTAPGRIEQRTRRIEGTRGHCRGVLVAGSGERQLVLDAVAIKIFLRDDQAAELRVVRVTVTLEQFRACHCVERAGTRRRCSLVGICGRFGRWIGFDRLEQSQEAFRLDESLTLDDLGAVGGEDDGGGPAVVAVAIGQVRAQILVDAQRYVVRGDFILDRLVAVALFVHDMAPVAPDGLEVEQHEAMLGTRPGECILVGTRPFDTLSVSVRLRRFGCACRTAEEAERHQHCRYGAGTHDAKPRRRRLDDCRCKRRIDFRFVAAASVHSGPQKNRSRLLPIMRLSCQPVESA